jgi:hypothetical protein
MTMFLRLANRVLASLQRIANLVCLFSGVMGFLLMLLSIYVTGTGGTPFRWLLAETGQDSWTTALSASALSVFEMSGACALGLLVVRFILRRVLLIGADTGVGVIASIRQTGTTVNQRPVMLLKIRVDTPEGPVIAPVRKLVDLGNIPRPGNRVRLRISRVDPTCVSYQGLV